MAVYYERGTPVERMPLGEIGRPHERLLSLHPPHLCHQLCYRVLFLSLMLLEEVVHFVLEEAVLRLIFGLKMRQLCLQGADRRLEVLRGHELRRRPRGRPGAPHCVRGRRLEAGKLRRQLRGGNGVRLRGRRLRLLQDRLLRRVRGGQERLERRDGAGVEAKQRSHLGRRRFVLAPGCARTESSSGQVLERRDAP